MIGRAELLQTLVDVITYLPIVEKFAFAKSSYQISLREKDPATDVGGIGRWLNA